MQEQRSQESKKPDLFGRAICLILLVAGMRNGFQQHRRNKDLRAS
jgi:hypothetical protein